MLHRVSFAVAGIACGPVSRGARHEGQGFLSGEPHGVRPVIASRDLSRARAVVTSAARGPGVLCAFSVLPVPRVERGCSRISCPGRPGPRQADRLCSGAVPGDCPPTHGPGRATSRGIPESLPFSPRPANESISIWNHSASGRGARLLRFSPVSPCYGPGPLPWRPRSIEAEPVRLVGVSREISPPSGTAP